MKRTRKFSLMAAAVLTFALSFQPFQAHAQNVISTVVGGGPISTAPLTADLPGVTSAVRDQAGNTFIAAPLSTNIFKLNTGGTFSVFAGQGYGGFNGDGGQASAAQLGSPAAIAFDSTGNLFFADYGSSRIRRVDKTTGVITTVAGSGEKCAHGFNPCGDGGLATDALLNLPQAIAIDSAGNIFIADSVDNKIRRVDAITKIITTVVGDGNPCANPSSACGDGGAATAAQLNLPEGIAVDAAGNLYVSDTADQRVRKVSGGIITAFAGNGGFCHDATTTCGDGHPATLANLHRPQQVALDALGNLYIADTLDHKIRVVDTTGEINLYAGLGVQGFGGDSGPATGALLDLPVGVSVDATGNVLIADSGNQRVRIVGSTGVIQTLAGGGSGGDGGAATSALLAGPYTVTGDTAGNLYIADTGNNRIRKVSNGTITTVAGTGSVGYSGDGASALNAKLNAPTSVAVDAQGNIFFSDTGNLVVRRVDAITHFISTYAGSGNSCFPITSACGDNGPATSANLTWPLTITLDANNNLYIADYFAFKIRKVNGATQVITTFAGNGQEGRTGDGGLATAARLDHPSGVAVDPSGNLFISDQYNNKVRKVDTSNIITTYMGTGKSCLCGDGGPALAGSMWNPLEVVTDPAGNVFVGGGNDNVVQRINGTTGIWGTVAGNAKKPLVGGFAGDGGQAAQATLANYGLWVDAQNNLYIADQGNNRIRTAHLTPAATFTPPSMSFGNVPLNTASPSKSYKLSSTGGVDLNLTSVSLTGTNPSNFNLTTTCPNPGLLGVNSICSGGVIFTPTFYGTAKALLTFTDNASNSPQTIALAGSGPDFGITASPTALTIARGSSKTATITLQPIAGFNQTISLSCLGSPAATTCTLNPTSVTLNGVNNGTSTVTITVGASTPPGIYNLTVKGAFVPLQHPAAITLTVQ